MRVIRLLETVPSVSLMWLRKASYSHPLLIVPAIPLVLLAACYLLNIGGRDRLLDVVLEVSAPSSSALLFIDGDGTMRYRAQAKNREEVTDQGQTTRAEVDALFDLIWENDFFSLEPSYPQESTHPHLGSTYRISISGTPESPWGDAYVKSVTCYEFACPRSFLVIKEKVLELWGRAVLEVGSGPPPVVRPLAVPTTSAAIWTPVPAEELQQLRNVAYPDSAPVEMGKFYEFTIYTHCRADFDVDFDGSLWQLNNPEAVPAGLDDPFQEGWMILIEENYARFEFEGGSILYIRHDGPQQLPGCE